LYHAWLRLLRKDDHGQDLSEYCLLTALVALIGLGLFLYASGGVQNLWTTANTTLAVGNTVSVGGGGATGSQSHGR
jgi:Flp pilus assembly pilin Flp